MTETGDDNRHGEEQAPTGLALSFDQRAAMIAILVVLILAVVATLLWQRVGDLEAADDDLRTITEAREAAADFLALLFTYSHEDFEEHEREVLAAATDRFDEFYTGSLDSGTRQSVLSTEAVSTAAVRDAWVGEHNGNDVSVIVLLDTDNVSLLGRRQLQGAWFRVRLELHEQAWLVDEFTNVLVEDEVFDPANGEGDPSEAPSG